MVASDGKRWGTTEYKRIHKMQARHNGSASEQVCPCGKQAAHWATIGDTFKAMCVPCHKRMDTHRDKDHEYDPGPGRCRTCFNAYRRERYRKGLEKRYA